MSDNKQLELPDKIGIEITSDSIWIGAMKEGVGCKKVDRIICSLDYKTFYSEKVRNLQLAIAERIVDSWNTRTPTEREKKLEEELRSLRVFLGHKYVSAHKKWRQEADQQALGEETAYDVAISKIDEILARAALEGEG